MKNIDIILYKNIKMHRLARCLSQNSLAKKLGVSHQAISKWETGENYPDFIGLISLGQLFEVSLDDLVYGENF